MEIRKKEGESGNAMLFRFTKRVKRAGILKEANKRRFRKRPQTKRARKLSALHREVKKAEVMPARTLGVL
jgi:ribosomal protein S21